MSSFGMGRDVHPLTLSMQHFLCPVALLALQAAPRDGFGEAVPDTPKLRKFPSLDTCQKFLGDHKEVDLAPHPVLVLVLKVF